MPSMPKALLQFVSKKSSRSLRHSSGRIKTIGIETDDVIEDSGRSTPTVDTGVKVKRRDTHEETLGPCTRSCGRLYEWTQ